jgi:GNAT superfamily N-acetyltransferase
MRRAGPGDAELMLDIQREACLAGFAHVFPPELYPFPSEAVLDEIRGQLADATNVALLDDDGFAVVGSGWLQKLYVRPAAWGTGLAGELHDAALAGLDGTHARLWTLEENHRARRFYEKRGWRLDEATRVVPYPPHPLDVGYTIDLGRVASGR